MVFVAVEHEDTQKVSSEQAHSLSLYSAKRSKVTLDHMETSSLCPMHADHDLPALFQIHKITANFESSWVEPRRHMAWVGYEGA